MYCFLHGPTYSCSSSWSPWAFFPFWNIVLQRFLHQGIVQEVASLHELLRFELPGDWECRDGLAIRFQPDQGRASPGRPLSILHRRDDRRREAAVRRGQGGGREGGIVYWRRQAAVRLGGVADKRWRV